MDVNKSAGDTAVVARPKHTPDTGHVYWNEQAIRFRRRIQLPLAGSSPQSHDFEMKDTIEICLIYKTTT